MTDQSIRILEPGDEAALETFLRPRIESSMFLLGNLQRSGLADHGERLQGTYVGAFDGDQIVGVVAHYQLGNLLLQAPENLDRLWREAVRASGRPVHGIVGPADQVYAIRDVLAAFGAEFSMDSCENLYSLSLTELHTPSLLLAGIAAGRRSQEDDLSLLTRWRVEYSIEALHENETDELWQQCEERTRQSNIEGTLWVLEIDGELVAMSGFNTTSDRAVQIGGVYTPPPLRGRGYARAVVAQSLLDARVEGAELAILFTDEENIAAHKAYGSLGFEIVGEYGLVLLSEGMMLNA